MKAVFIRGPKSFGLDEIERPDPGPDDALVRVKACGVCGSDIAYIDSGHAGFMTTGEGPWALGHEAAGEVVALGARVQGLEPGDRVILNPFDAVAMNAVGNGGPEGAFADFIRIRNVSAGGRLLPMPAGLGYDIAALAEPMGVALHTVNRSRAAPQSRVVVLGVGPIGLRAVIWLKHKGVRHITAVDLSEERLARAKGFGADAVIRAGQGDLRSQLLAVYGESARGAPPPDIYIDAAGSAAALQEVVATAKIGARLTVVAIYKKPVPLDLSAMLHKEMSLDTSIGYPDELEEVVAFLGENRARMADYISDYYPLEAFESAVAKARDPASAKVMVRMGA